MHFLILLLLYKNFNFIKIIKFYLNFFYVFVAIFIFIIIIFAIN